jgi:hypothetical protein
MMKPLLNIQSKPAFEARSGKIRAAVWENNTETGIAQSLSLTKSYKEGAQWRNTGSFLCEDLPDVSEVLTQAYEWMTQREQEVAEAQMAQAAIGTTDGETSPTPGRVVEAAINGGLPNF